ncbi:MAG: 8-hydroxy-5-deazaflavin:NADPH oxidoreductase [Gaiellaceae bacterium]|nr:8-hydroxy-5-deazaflavin:NADPH oxidoreductase [Gaiellaceae bacterium]
MKVAVLGGTGAFGSALARRLVEAGLEVSIGSREPDRAAATAAELGAARGVANADAVDGVDLVVLAVLASAALDTAADLADAIGESPVLSVASEVRVEGGVAFPGDDPLSLAERTQELLRGPVVAGLHSLAASSLASGKAAGDALVCGDDDAAKALALELSAQLVTGRALDAGPLASARALEGMTAVIVNLNRRYRGHAGLSIEGL